MFGLGVGEGGAGIVLLSWVLDQYILYTRIIQYITHSTVNIWTVSTIIFFDTVYPVHTCYNPRVLFVLTLGFCKGYPRLFGPKIFLFIFAKVSTKSKAKIWNPKCRNLFFFHVRKHFGYLKNTIRSKISRHSSFKVWKIHLCLITNKYAW